MGLMFTAALEMILVNRPLFTPLANLTATSRLQPGS
jgi:hypothetical protein